MKSKQVFEQKVSEAIDTSENLTGSIVFVDGVETTIIADNGDTVVVEVNGLQQEIAKTDLGEVQDVAEVVITEPVKLGDWIATPGDVVTIKSEAFVKRQAELREKAKKALKK